LLQATNRLSEAEPLYRRALAIDEHSYGPDHSDVARELNNLAFLLQATNRLSEAEPLMARAVRIWSGFQRATGHEHRHLQGAINGYRQLLSERNLSEPEITARIKTAREGTDKLSPIVPDVERLLGPAKPVADVLTALDRQYKEQGRPAIYFLKPNEPIAPYLDELCRPNVDALNVMGVTALQGRAPARAVVDFEAALELMAGRPATAPTKLWTRMNRAAALRELGLVEEARDELVKVIPEIEQNPDADALMKGRARYHLALCQWRLGDRAAAERSAEKSLAAYDRAPKPSPVDPALRRQSEELLADVKNGKVPPPPAAHNPAAELEAARAAYRAGEALAKLPLDQKTAPLVGQLLGPARSTAEVFEALDRQYREQGKPAVWFLPLDQPIAPHLDELLGKAPTRDAGGRTPEARQVK
jgi:tetratricopeptide (TPR) repeat protein